MSVTITSRTISIITMPTFIILAFVCFVICALRAETLPTPQRIMTVKQWLTDSLNTTADKKNLNEKKINSLQSNEITTNPGNALDSNDTLIGITVTGYKHFDFPKIGYKKFIGKLFDALKELEFFLNLKPMVVKTSSKYVFLNKTAINNIGVTSNHTAKSSTDQGLETNTESPLNAIPTQIPGKTDKNDKDDSHIEGTTKISKNTPREFNLKTKELITNKKNEKEKPKNKESRLKYTELLKPEIAIEHKESQKIEEKFEKKRATGFLSQAASAVMTELKTIGSWFGLDRIARWFGFY